QQALEARDQQRDLDLGVGEEAAPCRGRLVRHRPNHGKLRLRRVRKLLIAILLAGVLAAGALAAGTIPTDPPGAIAGAFTKRSYAPGDEATLVLTHPVSHAALSLLAPAARPD